MLKRTGDIILKLCPKAVVTALTAVFISAALLSAAAPEVSFSISQKEVLLGDSVILTITARGISNPNTPELPSMDGLDVKFRGVRQESFSSFQVIINGKNIQKKSSGGGYNFDYELIPKRAGTIIIPSFQIELGGKKYQTQSFQLSVLEKSAKSKDVFLKIEVDKNKVYLGEKIIVTFNWYMNKDIAEYRLNVPWLDALKNFLVADPELDKNTKYQRLIVNDGKQVAAVKRREIFNGQPYAVISFQKILTPISVGHYELESSFLKCDIITGYKKSKNRGFFDDFFNSSVDDFFGMGKNAVTEPFATRSEPLSISVQEVPTAKRPADYNGAVGDFDFSVDVNPKSLKAGEPITVTMKVSGSGNIEQLEMPELPEMPEFKSYEPESKVNVSHKGGEVRGEKIFEKVLIPRHKGQFIIPAIHFSFFNPKRSQYQTITRGPFRIHAEKGEEVNEVKVITMDSDTGGTVQNKEIKVITKDIRYIKTDLGPSEKTAEKFYENTLVWIAAYSFPLLLLFTVFIWSKRQQRFQTDVGFARSKRAYKKIRPYLQNAERFMNEEDVIGFYDALSRALNSYIADKLNLPEARITSAVVGDISRSGLDAETSEELARLYNTFEEVLFSSVRPDKNILMEDYDRVKNIIIALERVLK